jgi:hypothetical protein
MKIPNPAPRAARILFGIVVLSLITDRCPAQQAGDANASRKAKGAVTSGFLGVQVATLTPELRAFFGASKEMGILVSKVEKESPAQKGGLKVGDVIEKADGQAVVSVWMLERLVREKRTGEALVVEVVRAKKARVIKVAMEERARPQVDLANLFHWQWPQGGQIKVDLIDPQAFIQASERFREMFTEPMILTRMQEMQRLIKREKTLELRIKKLEKRILQLETQLRD